MFVSRAMSDFLCRVDAVKDKDESARQPSTLGIHTPPTPTPGPLLIGYGRKSGALCQYKPAYGSCRCRAQAISDRLQCARRGFEDDRITFSFLYFLRFRNTRLQRLNQRTQHEMYEYNSLLLTSLFK